MSSRFEGTVYRVAPDGSAEPFARDLGVACGLAFDADGAMFVGDRSGTIFRVDADARATVVATLPRASRRFTWRSGPTSPSTSPARRCRRAIRSTAWHSTALSTAYAGGFGRPQGLAFDADGSLFVVDALAGVERSLPRAIRPRARARPGRLGADRLAFDRAGGLVVCSNETAYRLAAVADTHHLQ